MSVQLIVFVVVLAQIATNAEARGNSESSPQSVGQKPGVGLAPQIPGITLKVANAGFDVPTREIKSTDFELGLLGGGTTRLSSYEGKLVLLNFWATWCPSCREEIPSMEKLYTRFKEKGLVLAAVDLSESGPVVQKFVATNKITYPVLLDASGTVGEQYGARTIPTTYIIDRKGRILGRAIGARTWDSPEMVSLFETLLAG